MCGSKENEKEICWSWNQSSRVDDCHHDDHRINKHNFDMDGVREVKTLKNSFKKPESRKEVSVAFQRNLNDKFGAKNRDRPKSANYYDSYEKSSKKRPSSSEPLLGTCDRFGLDFSEQKTTKKVLQARECCCCCPEAARECSSLLEVESSLPELNYSRYSCRARRKCRSNPNVSKTGLQKCKKILDTERDVNKIKRSLRLLGFELSDFGICSDSADRSPSWKPRQRSLLCTKITNRSISLDSLRETVRRAWLDDSLDGSHRRVLAQAAYEEWYFRKERELWERRSLERMSRLKREENLRVDFQRKKEKSEEEFQKWLQRKRSKRKEQLIQKHEPITRLKKTEAESEKAFIKWKQTKEKELLKRKIERSVEEDRKRDSERQKHEKKIIAEKAFQQWKTKLEETEKLIQVKRRKQRRKLEEEERRRREQGSQISFEMWKAAKDEQIKRRIKQIRDAERIAREERLAQMEERMYEAEQAFEDWLERVDLRKQKQICHLNSYQKNIPWIPA